MAVRDPAGSVYATNVTLYELSSSGSVLASTPISNNPAGQTFFVDAHLAKASPPIWIRRRVFADFVAAQIERGTHHEFILICGE
jgi:hypothetical protein